MRTKDVSVLTPLASVINKQDLAEQRPRRTVDDTPHGSQQCGPRFVVKHYHYGCCW